ncbi:hypothetical protein N7451_008392 [Penicillium sp. IBT 35674x]|nr:hypothetical protein N7451_008392 [Penicillium sp. IBT 35674x]
MASYVMEYPNYGNATRKCLDTPELLEMILTQTDVRTLLTSARVSRNWFNLISTSPSIQKALFFAPIKESEWGREERFLNPLLTEAFPSLFPTKDKLYNDHFDIRELPMVKDTLTVAQFTRKDASWRKMLVQQPPISGIGLFAIESAMGGKSVQCSSVPPDQKMQECGYDGLRMERLFEVLLLTRFTSPEVYWSAEGSIEFDAYSEKINDVFYQNLSKFGLVLCTRTVRQCAMGWIDRRPRPGADVRYNIIEAYRAHGLDVDLKEQDIEESEVEGELVSVPRGE